MKRERQEKGKEKVSDHIYYLENGRKKIRKNKFIINK
jgi:hypothetical protein